MTQHDREPPRMKKAAENLRPWGPVIGGLLHLVSVVVSWLGGS